MEVILNIVLFAIITIILRSFFNKNNSKFEWGGNLTLIAICILGIYTENVNYFAAILGVIIGRRGE